MDGTWCLARDGEGLCPAPVAAVNPVPLCRAHQLEVALQVVPGVLAESWGNARVGLAGPDSLIDNAVPLRIPEILPRSHGPIVYFVENGNRVKIGTTTRLAQRVGSLSLRPDSIRLLLPGGPDLEGALHRRFESSRVSRTEWFNPSQELATFIRRKQQIGACGEIVEVADLPASAPESKIETEQARTLVLQYINDLADQGEVALGAKSFAPLMPQLTRSRSWLVVELQRLVGVGFLSQEEPGRYLITANLPGGEPA